MDSELVGRRANPLDTGRGMQSTSPDNPITVFSDDARDPAEIAGRPRTPIYVISTISGVPSMSAAFCARATPR